MQIMITGDRSAFPPALAPIVAIEMLKRLADANQKGETLQLWTGDFKGAELTVRTLAKAAGLTLSVMPPTPTLASGKYDLENRALYMSSIGLDAIVFIHGDPQVSSVYKSLIAVPALADKVELLLPDVVLVDPAGE